MKIFSKIALSFAAILLSLAAHADSDYPPKVKPIVEQRCMVCHGCYDAPCQLKLNSFAGVSRGANPEKVYNGSRIKAATKTRLFVHAQTTEEWRQMDFHTVLNETPDSTPKANLENSAMYQILRLKLRCKEI